MVQKRTVHLELPRSMPSGEIVAIEVPDEIYMDTYAERFHEWIEGVVIKMPPISGTHDDLSGYLRELFRAYFHLNPIGKVRLAPFVLRLDSVGSRREPDLQIILNENLSRLRETFVDGPADIAIEIVSEGTAKTDYGDKLTEYERGGVSEYWMIDPLRKQCLFYRLNDAGKFGIVAPGDENVYKTPLLPKFQLRVPIPLPDIFTVIQSVQQMLER